MILQTVSYPEKSICSDSGLYFHREGEWILFDGYFNLFYLEKHHKYCQIEELTLELVVSGIKKVQVMHDRDVILEQEIEVLAPSGMDRLKGKVPTLDDDRRISIKLPYAEYEKGVFWFRIEVADEKNSWSVEGYYEGTSVEVNDNIELVVNICTFRREHYVARNMRALRSWMESVNIDGMTPEAARHIHVFVVDNGKSLCGNEEFKSAVDGMASKKAFLEVIENDNTGGCGGFSRGMREAISRKEELGLTHLLMMDDDAVFDPEMFVRLYGLLTLLRDEYKEITVGGALMREDYPYIQHAAGEWYGQFKVRNDHLMADLRDLDVCCSDWMTGTADEKRVYGAWWCCCYHMSAVTAENLPLPIFVHHDDIQFGLKQKDRGIVFLNGVCVWHQGFELVFPGAKQYYNMRNTLITSAMYEPEFLRKNLKKWAVRRYIGMLISYRYGDCEFVYRGLMDFLKGREWLVGSDPEAIHKELIEQYRKICPMESIEKMLSGKDLVMARGVVKDIEQRISLDVIRNYYSHDRYESNIKKKLTFNGWFLPGEDDIKVITPLDSPWDTYRHKGVLLYEPAIRKGCIMRRSSAEFFKGMWRIAMMFFAIDKWKLGGGKW